MRHTCNTFDKDIKTEPCVYLLQIKNDGCVHYKSIIVLKTKQIRARINTVV